MSELNNFGRAKTVNNKLKKIGNIFSSVLVGLVVVLTLLLVGVRLFGFQVYSVLSGSMEPTYQTGSLIYVKKVDPFTLETGDVITFMVDADTVATHRIAGIVPDEDDPDVIRFRTKGDCNEEEDAKLVHCANVIGVPVFTIPKLGYLASYIQEPPGSYVAISAAAFLLMLMFLPELFSSEEKQAEERPTREKRSKKEHTHKKEKLAKPVRERTIREKAAPTRKVRSAPKVLEPAAPKSLPAVQSPQTVEPPASDVEEEVYDLESILAEFR